MDCVRFLWHLMQQIEGKMIVVWDNLPPHRGRIVREALKGAAGKRIHLEALPPYAPDLNPDEGVWKHLKYVELRNVCCTTREMLLAEIRKAIARLRHKKHVIIGCFAGAGLSI